MRSVFVGYFSYATNYNRDLVISFREISQKYDKIFLCGRIDENIKDGKYPKVDKIWRKDPRFVYDIFSYVKKHRADIIYFQQEFKTYGGIFSAFLFPLLILFLKIGGYKVVVTSHAAVSIYQVNKEFLEMFGIKNSFFSRILVRFFLKYSYFFTSLFADVVTVHTSVLKDILLKDYGAKPSKIVVIESGVREIKNLTIPQNSEVVRKFPELKGKTIILIFGFFSPRKGFETIIKAFSKFVKKKLTKKFILVLAGDVTKEYLFYRRKIERLIEIESLTDSTLITGYVTGQEVDELFRLAKVVVLPAVITFNISGALVFALAYHKPVLASSAGPLREDVKNNNLGFVYDSKSVKSCQKNLERILFDNVSYKHFLRNVSQVAERRYWKQIAKEHYQLFERLLSK